MAISINDDRFGFYKTSAEDVEWVGEFALDTMTYVGVVRYSRATGFPPPCATPLTVSTGCGPRMNWKPSCG